MGGKTLKYPVRQKYKPQDKTVDMPEEKVSDEEYKKRMEMLKKLGLVKEEVKEEKQEEKAEEKKE